MVKYHVNILVRERPIKILNFFTYKGPFNNFTDADNEAKRLIEIFKKSNKLADFFIEKMDDDKLLHTYDYNQI